MILILEFSRALGETADGPAELFDHEGVRVIAPVRPYHGARPEKYFVDGAPAFLDRPAQTNSQRLNSFSGGTSASPGGFHDWKTLYQDRHRFYMWLHTYIDEAKLHYCKPTVPLLEIKNNAEAIYSKKQQ